LGREDDISGIYPEVANGTQVNNQRIASGSRQALSPGDQIRLGTWQAKFG